MRPILAVLLATSLALSLSACKGDRKAQANLAAGQTFLTTNAKAPGVVSLPSGLQYKIVRSGPADGPHPHVGDEIKVNYEGKLLSGEVFDSSFQLGEPADFPLQGLIPGWV